MNAPRRWTEREHVAPQGDEALLTALASLLPSHSIEVRPVLQVKAFSAKKGRQVVTVDATSTSTIDEIAARIVGELEAS